MDISEALAPNGDQLDAIELVVPRTFTIDSGSRLGTREGRRVYEIRLVDFPRVWRPSKGMLDVLAGCWGLDGSQWVGRRVTLYNDPEVRFGPNKIGGIRISHISHVDRETTLQIRAPGVGKKMPWTVRPIPDEARVNRPLDEPTAEMIEKSTDENELTDWWHKSGPETRALIEARVKALRADVTS